MGRLLIFSSRTCMSASVSPILIYPFLGDVLCISVNKYKLGMDSITLNMHHLSIDYSKSS